MNKLILFALGVFFISLASAIYPGECSNITFPNSNNVTFELISNTSIIDGFNWTQNKTEITYCFSADFPIGNYTFRWFNTEEVIVESHGGSHSHSSVKATTNVTIPSSTNLTNNTINPIETEIIQGNETIIVMPPEDKQFPFVLLTILFFVIGIIIALYFYFKSRHSNIDVRRLDENE